MGLPWWLSGKEYACSAEDGLDPWAGKILGGGHCNPLLHYRLENYVDRGALWASVHGVTESDRTEATDQQRERLTRGHHVSRGREMTGCRFHTARRQKNLWLVSSCPFIYFPATSKH